MWNSKRMARIRSIGIGLFLFGLLFAFVWYNKAHVRTAPSTGKVIGYLSGVFPNFIAAFILSTATYYPALTGRVKYPRAIVYANAALAFFLLTAEECTSLCGASETYDPYDIVASAVGSALAILTFEILSRLLKTQSGVS